MNISIVSFNKEFYSDIQVICYQTGYLGESLVGTNLFNDKILFCNIFCNYYLKYEKENCFFAYDEENGKCVGYIIGSMNTKKQEKMFLFRFLPKILLRVLFVTIFAYPETIKSIIYFLKNNKSEKYSKTMYREYPAHFHIDILKEYQRYGIGTKLINKYEEHMKNNNIEGIHLKTSSLNVKSIPFYKKNGFTIFSERIISPWKNMKNIKEIIFCKKLKDG